jgi:hypothetical protein
MTRMAYPHAALLNFVPGMRPCTASPSELNLGHFPYLSLVDPALETLRDVADVGGGSSPAVAEIIGVDAARVVLAKGRVDGLGAPQVTPVLKVCLVVLGTSDNHGGDFVL